MTCKEHCHPKDHNLSELKVGDFYCDHGHSGECPYLNAAAPPPGAAAQAAAPTCRNNHPLVKVCFFFLLFCVILESFRLIVELLNEKMIDDVLFVCCFSLKKRIIRRIAVRNVTNARPVFTRVSTAPSATMTAVWPALPRRLQQQQQQLLQ